MGRDDSPHLDIFRRLRSSALAFWAKVRLSASARLSTAMARKTFRRMSGGTVLRALRNASVLLGEFPGSCLGRMGHRVFPA